MRKVIYAFSVSLDGFIETVDGDISWSYPAEDLHKHFNLRESAIDLYLYGRRLYEEMAAYWPKVEDDPSASEVEKEYARIWKSKPKVVYSTKLQHVAWNARLASGNIAEEVKKLKEQPGRDMTVGGASLASTFMELGLIDEYWLYVQPVILGGGKPMFSRPGARMNLHLVENRRFGRGVALLRYGRAGAGEG